VTLPAAQEIVVRVAGGIEAASTQTGLLYTATVNTPVLVDGRPAIPAGTSAEVEVTVFEKPGRVNGGGRLDLALKNVTMGGHRYTVASDAFELTGTSRVKRSGKFGLIGAVAGGVAHGVKGAVKGGGAGAASAISELDLAPESLVTFHLTAPLTLPAR
jgi:hypothetical protein